MWQNKYFKQTPLQAKFTACLFSSNYCFEVLFPAVFFTTLPKYQKKRGRIHFQHSQNDEHTNDDRPEWSEHCLVSMIKASWHEESGIRTKILSLSPIQCIFLLLMSEIWPEKFQIVLLQNLPIIQKNN